MGKAIILNHHERANETGYPRKLEAHYFNTEYDRLVSIINEFCYLIGNNDHQSDNENKKHALTNKAALDELQEQTKLGNFLLEDFTFLINNIYMYPTLSIIELNMGENVIVEAIVCAQTNDKTRPIVFVNTKGYLDLSSNENKYIKINDKKINETKNTEKIEIKTNIKYISEKKSIEVELIEKNKKIKCPYQGDIHYLLPPSLPKKITDEHKLGNCLDIIKAHTICEKNHFCIITLEPPKRCEYLSCEEPEEDCVIQGWKVFSKGFYT